jgi:hypothetical protein
MLAFGAGSPSALLLLRFSDQKYHKERDIVQRLQVTKKRCMRTNKNDKFHNVVADFKIGKIIFFLPEKKSCCRNRQQLP